MSYVPNLYGAVSSLDEEETAPGFAGRSAAQHEESTFLRSLVHSKDLKEKLRTWGFWAGLCYCVIILCGITAEMGIRDQLVDFNDATTTAQNIQESITSFRLCIILDFIMLCADVTVCVLFTFILISTGANPVVSALSVLFRFMQQVIIGGNLLNLIAVSILLDPGLHPALPVNSVLLAANQDPSVWAFFFLSLHKYGYLLALILFGISMILLGGIVLRYGILPKSLGVVIGLAGIGYCTDSLLFFLRAGYDGGLSSFLMIPAFVGEFWMTGYLLFYPPKSFTSQKTNNNA